jgi:hypothetical protein
MSVWFLKQLKGNDTESLRETLETSWKQNGKCWEWTGPRNKQGYGLLKGKTVHRISYALFISDFRVGSYICHTCDNPICYNPDHLYEGDAKTNGADAKRRNRLKPTVSVYSRFK